ncbi:unnamed protein product [Linum trigynum]|uniref:Uncharacterized protein n=1 Tax=Linum trigynum TaxID=586398 RepID=A0AAV2CXD7_9ROSI
MLQCSLSTPLPPFDLKLGEKVEQACARIHLLTFEEEEEVEEAINDDPVEQDGLILESSRGEDHQQCFANDFHTFTHPKPTLKTKSRGHRCKMTL